MRQIIPTSHFRLQLAYKQKKERQKEALQRMVHGVGMIGVDQTWSHQAGKLTPIPPDLWLYCFLQENV